MIVKNKNIQIIIYFKRFTLRTYLISVFRKQLDSAYIAHAKVEYKFYSALFEDHTESVCDLYDALTSSTDKLKLGFVGKRKGCIVASAPTRKPSTA